MDVWQEHERQTLFRNAVSEYERLLGFQTLDDLRTLALRWNVELSSGNKASVVKQLAAHFGEPCIQQAVHKELDAVGRQVLAYLHLFLAPEYGLSADSIVRGMLYHRQRSAQPAHTGESSLSLYNEQWSQDADQRRKLYEQIAELAASGLLLPFKQKGAFYYTLPNLVRSHLPPWPGVVPAYAGELDVLDIREIAFGMLVHDLFAVWNALSRGLPGVDAPVVRYSGPPRLPIEDQWSLLRGWTHEPAEIAILMKSQYPSAPLRLDRIAAANLNWAMTVPAPFPRLRDGDLRQIRDHIEGTDSQTEFYCALLEKLGALSGAPGEPIAVHRDAMQSFLRLSASAKTQVLWNAWTDDQTWSEMQAILVQEGQSSLRLRRSLARQNYKALDLYQEWHTARQIVLRFLTLLPDGQWLSTDGLLKAVFDMHPNLLHTSSDPSVWWLESSRTGRQFGTAFEDWQQSYGQFVLSMLCGPLYWLGMVRLAYVIPDGEKTEPADKPVAFQLTETALFVLGRRSEPKSEQAPSPVSGESPCVVSTGLTVTLVPDRAPLDVHNLLHSTGRLLDATPDRFVYQMTAEGVSSWLASQSTTVTGLPQGKGSVDALIAVLSKYCHSSNTDWQETLRTWERNQGLLHIYENITLLELADDYALQELLISTSLADQLIHQFSPRLIAVSADGVDLLVEEMERRGYTPRVQ